jgi:hypothetical protein
MQLIDILDMCALKTKKKFKFYVKWDANCTAENCIHWVYENGKITDAHGTDRIFVLIPDTYKLDSEVVEIKEEEELPPLEKITTEWIQSDKEGPVYLLHYGDKTSARDSQSELLSAAINTVIMELEKTRKELHELKKGNK